MQISITYAPKEVLPNNDRNPSHIPNSNLNRLHLPSYLDFIANYAYKCCLKTVYVKDHIPVDQYICRSKFYKRSISKLAISRCSSSAVALVVLEITRPRCKEVYSREGENYHASVIVTFASRSC